MDLKKCLQSSKKMQKNSSFFKCESGQTLVLSHSYFFTNLILRVMLITNKYKYIGGNESWHFCT